MQYKRVIFKKKNRTFTVEICTQSEIIIKCRKENIYLCNSKDINHIISLKLHKYTFYEITNYIKIPSIPLKIQSTSQSVANYLPNYSDRPKQFRTVIWQCYT